MKIFQFVKFGKPITWQLASLMLKMDRTAFFYKLLTSKNNINYEAFCQSNLFLHSSCAYSNMLCMIYTSFFDQIQSPHVFSIATTAFPYIHPTWWYIWLIDSIMSPFVVLERSKCGMIYMYYIIKSCMNCKKLALKSWLKAR